jgi:hypothetical protein
MMNSKSNRQTTVFLWVAIVTVALLLIPAIAMQFTDEVNWGALDFLLMGVLLFVTGSLAVLTWQKINPKYRMIAIIGVLLMILLIWAELAVGVFTEIGS